MAISLILGINYLFLGEVAYNEFIGDKAQLIEDCKEMIQVLDNTAELEARLAALNQKAEDIIVLVKNFIPKLH